MTCAIERELSKVTKVVLKPKEKREYYLKRLVEAGQHVPDKTWQALSDEAKAWYNTAVKAFVVNHNPTDIQDFEPEEEVLPEDNPDVAEADLEAENAEEEYAEEGEEPAEEEYAEEESAEEEPEEAEEEYAEEGEEPAEEESAEEEPEEAEEAEPEGEPDEQEEEEVAQPAPRKPIPKPAPAAAKPAAKPAPVAARPATKPAPVAAKPVAKPAAKPAPVAAKPAVKPAPVAARPAVKPAPAAAPAPSVPKKAVGAMSVIKRLVIRQPDITVAELTEKIRAQGFSITDLTIAQIRTDLRQTIKLLQEANYLEDMQL